MEEKEKKTNSLKTTALFKEFMEKLHGPNGDQLKKILVSYLKKIQNQKLVADELQTEIQNFIIDFGKTVENEIGEEDSAGTELNEEAIEGIVCKALYNKIMDQYEKQPDLNLDRAMKKFNFIELSHLESQIPIEGTSSLEMAIESFQSINSMKTPKEKLNGIVNSCKISSGLVLNCQKQNMVPTGADDFLPVLVYVVLKANPTNAHSNVNFIRDYRAPHRFKGLEEYYHAAFESSIEFIEGIDEKKLKISSEEFHSKVKEMCIKFNLESTNESSGIGNEESTEIERELPMNGVPSQPSRLLYLQSKTNDIQTKINSLKFRFVGKEVYNLTVSEVPDLIEEYKNLVNTIAFVRETFDEMTKSFEISEKAILGDLKPNAEGLTMNQGKRFFGFF